MSQKLAALVMMFGGSTFSLAQTAEKTQTPAEVDAEIENDIATADVSSGHFSAELGLGLRKGMGPEVRLNWYRDDDQVYGIKFGQYSAKDLSNFDTITLTSVGLQSRFSLEGSYFLEGGVDMTQIKAKIDEADTISTSNSGTYGFEGSVSQTSLQLTFGNQWQTGSWTYGIDWVDLYVPFSGSSFKTSTSGTIIDREARERRNKRDLKTEAWDINYGFSVHAGIVF